MRHKLIKWFHYEFWPFWLFYIPIVPLWLWFSLKSRSLIYFCNANPGIKWGGFFNYSKYDILRQLPDSRIPKTLFINNIISSEAPLDFPFIAKPDFGERGFGVELIQNQSDWKDYISIYDKNIIIQNYVEAPFEFGIFYVCLPNKEKGDILSITTKEFLVFKGDGKTTLQEFISTHSRAYFRKEYLEKKHRNKLQIVLAEGEEFILEPIGNHSRGTKFLDASYLITKELIEKTDEIAKHLKGFYYGRFDVKAESIMAFKEGKYTVLEVNGANSEATHIYDPKYSIFFAYKEVFRHLKWQFEIAKENKKKGYKPDSIKEFFKIIIDKTEI